MLTLNELDERAAQDEWYLPRFGASPQTVTAKKELAAAVLRTFSDSFPDSGSRTGVACFVPGRLELLGKHTDYAGGHSWVGAVDRGFFCVASRNGTGRIRMVPAKSSFPPIEFELSSALQPVVGTWGNYPITVAKRLASNFADELGAAPCGVDVAFASDLPIAAGLSGSSALMILTFFALALPNQLMRSKTFQRNIVTGVDLATYLACIENGQSFRDLPGGGGVGTFGGSEDHAAIMLSEAGCTSLFRFCPTVHESTSCFPEDLAIVVANSGVQAPKTGTAMEQFNHVSRRAALAVAKFNSDFQASHSNLREIVTDVCSRRLGDQAAVERNFQKDAASRDLWERYVQFQREDTEFIPEALRALSARDYSRLGRVIDESHDLSREYLRNIIPEIDRLQRSARALGAVAASGFGAGFGGSAYAIVPKPLECEFQKAWREDYLRQFPERSGVVEIFAVSLSGRAGAMFE